MPTASLGSHVAPVCPVAANRKGIRDAVILDAVIGEDGHVSSVKMIGGNPVLADAAKGAVEQWVYRTILLNGVPIEVVVKVRVPFVCPQPAQAPPPSETSDAAAGSGK
jgi:outer membrane biosynthesis protein TonB